MNSNDFFNCPDELPIIDQSIGKLFSNQPANYYQNPKSKLILFSCDPLLGKLVRSHLYHFTSSYFDDVYLADGGILDMDNISAETLKIFELAITQNKTIVLIGAEPEFFGKIQNLLDKKYQPHCISFISDQCAPLENLELDSIYLKELNIIGFQRQNTLNPAKSINYFRLGEYRNNPACIEPAVRRSEMIYFNLNSIRSSDNPGSENKNPSGFFAEEAASISRTAGMSDRLKIFAISTWNENKDSEKITSNLAAQLIWYFWEGCHLKKLDQNLDKESLTQYLVEIKNLDYIITFYKSENSGKWWFEEPLVDNEISNQLIPCSYDEYLSTVNDQIPKRILEMING